MAQAAGTTDLEKQLAFLTQNAHRISFYQAVLSIEALLEGTAALGEKGPAQKERIRLRPSLSLACPAADLESIALLDNGRVQITTTFLGLYGADSPLPYYFGEHLAQNAHEESGQRVRAFLDIFHHRLLSLLYRAWQKARLTARGIDYQQPIWDRILSFVGHNFKQGLGGRRAPRLPEARMGLLQDRTAAGLESLIAYRLGYACRVDQHQPRKVAVPPDQLSCLGQQNMALGGGLMLGPRITDCNRICLCFEATDYTIYTRLMPGGADREVLEQLLENYLQQPMDYLIEVTLPAEQAPHWQLGRHQLGRNTWLAKPPQKAKGLWPGSRTSNPL